MARCQGAFAGAWETIHLRPRDRILSFFDGLRLLEPGLRSGTDRCPDRLYPKPSGRIAAGVARRS